MESQLHRHYDDPLQTKGTDVHVEREHGGETKSAMKKVKAKIDKLKDTVNHNHGHHDGEDHDTKTMNDSAPVRSGMVQPTDMGTPVLAEDLYATHSDIVDPPVRSFAQWEEEERHGEPPPLSTGYGTHLTDLAQVSHHVYAHDVNNEQIEQLTSSIGKSTGMEEDPNAPNLTTTVSPLQTNTGGKEVGITGVLKSFDKMAIFDEPDYKSKSPTPKSAQIEHNAYTGSHDQFAQEHIENPPVDTISKSPKSQQNVYTGSHDQFAPEHEQIVYTGSHDQSATQPIVNPPLDTISADPNSSYAQKVTSATSAIADKAAEVKDTIVSKLGLSGENKTSKNSSFSSTDFAHKVADTMTGTFVPVYEKVVGAKTAVMSKLPEMSAPEGKKVTVREYLVDTFRPGDEDKVLSEVITNAFHRGKGNATTQETSTYVRDEGERRLQDSSN